MLGAVASCWNLSSREFTFQLVAPPSGNGKRKVKSKEFVFSLWFAVLGRLRYHLSVGRRAREFTFQFVAVTLGFAFSIFIFLRDSLCHCSVATALA